MRQNLDKKIISVIFAWKKEGENVYHLIIALLSYVCFIFLIHVPVNIRIGFAGIFIISSIFFFYEAMKDRKKQKSHELLKMAFKENMKKINASFIKEVKEDLPLAGYKMFCFKKEGKNEEIFFFTSDALLIQAVRDLKEPVVVYYIGDILFFIEKIKNEKEVPLCKKV